jgi:hypothetical protein
MHQGDIVAKFPAEDAKIAIHRQFQAMIDAEIPEEEAVAETSYLSRNCGMDADSWP